MRLNFYSFIMMLVLGFGQAWAAPNKDNSNKEIKKVSDMDAHISSLKLTGNQLDYVNFNAEANNYSLPANVVAKNNAGGWYADSIVLTNAKDYTADADLYANSITYTRNFTEGVVSKRVWQPLYVPFGFNPADYSEDFDIAEIFTIAPTKDTNNDGVIDGSDDIQMIVTIVKDGTTKPNVPYLIRPKRAGDHTIVTDGILKAASEECLELCSSRSAYR